MNVPLQDPQIRFIFDHLVDATRDNSLILWEALDTKTNERVWILGRSLGENKGVMPLGQLLPDTQATVARFAPSDMAGGWHMDLIGGRIVKP
jgi:hypothetical protein